MLKTSVASSALLLSLLASGCAVEAGFRLAPESRLPKWIHTRSDLSRAQVTLEREDYVGIVGPDARFRLWDDKGNLIDEVGVRLDKEVRMMPGARSAADGPLEYPFYELVTVRGISEVIEFRRMEPIFYVNDDPLVKAKFERQN